MFISYPHMCISYPQAAPLYPQNIGLTVYKSGVMHRNLKIWGKLSTIVTLPVDKLSTGAPLEIQGIFQEIVNGIVNGPPLPPPLAPTGAEIFRSLWVLLFFAGYRYEPQKCDYKTDKDKNCRAPDYNQNQHRRIFCR